MKLLSNVNEVSAITMVMSTSKPTLLRKLLLQSKRNCNQEGKSDLKLQKRYIQNYCLVMVMLIKCVILNQDVHHHQIQMLSREQRTVTK